MQKGWGNTSQELVYQIEGVLDSRLRNLGSLEQLLFNFSLERVIYKRRGRMQESQAHPQPPGRGYGVGVLLVKTIRYSQQEMSQ